VQQQHVPPRRGVGLQRELSHAGDVGHRVDGELAVREVDSAGFRVDDRHPHVREEAQDAPRLGRAREVVVPGDHHDGGARQLAAEPRELLERLEDRRVRRPDVVEHVARDHDQVGLESDRAIDRAPERPRHVRLPLIDPGGGQALELAEAEVEVGEVDEAQRRGRV
jgi:hypothetical protein